MPIKLTERTLYLPLSEYLEKEANAKTISEVGVKRGYLDIFFKLDASPFIAEIKLGREEKAFTKAVAQVVDYALDYGTRNVVVLVFPHIKSGQMIVDIEKFKQELISQKVRGWIHTDYLDTWIEDKKFGEIIRELKKAFENKEKLIDFNSIIKAIREIVQDLFEVIKQAKTGEIFEEVAEKLELFAGLGEIKDKQKAESQVSMLSSYLFFNQLLFYQIYKTKSRDQSLPELKPVKSLKEIQEYFKKITDIDYQPIYNIHLIERIPENNDTLTLINDAIKNLIVLRAEYITQDLAGRFFHALLPKEVAKTWAAFYTNPIAAQILAHLAINKWDETVIDPACGSGTLLSAVYRRKLELSEEQLKKELDEEVLKKLHKKFIEEDITGIDIMPFATHLSAINLSLQKLEQPTEKVRIARADSLELAPSLLSPKFKENGVLLKSFGETIQLALFSKGKTLRQRIEPISPKGEGEEFYIRPADVVIMNPPFSDREKLPKDYKEKLSDGTDFGKILGEKCGHLINLWGYFLSLADLMLKPNGRVAIVVPINITRGKATEKIRNYLLENYHIKYIIKSTKDFGFSESAAFRDILLIAEKRKPLNDDITTIIFLKKSIRIISLEEVKNIVGKLRGKKEDYYKDNLCEMFTVRYRDFRKKNFIEWIWATSYRNLSIVNTFCEQIEKTGKDKLTKIDAENLKEGFHTSPKGISQLVFITDPIDKSRTERSFLTFEKESDDFIYLKLRNTNEEFKVSKDKIIKSLKTVTSIKRIDISKLQDYLILDKFDGFEKVLTLSLYKDKEKFNWGTIKRNVEGKGTHVTVFRRFNPVSPNTFILSFYSEINFVPTDAFKILKCDKESAIFICIYLNSILAFAKLISNMQQTTGQYTDIKAEDLELFNLFNIQNLSIDEKQILLNLFEKIRNIEFPSIIEQIEKRFWARVELDKTVLRILGFSNKEIGEWLPKVYDAIVEELKTIKEIK